MKKFFAAVTMSVLLPVTVFAAYTPGSYTATVNSNIRSMPSMSGLRIGHYNQGDSVTVLGTVGSWCRVAYKYYNSYVYCSLLAPAVASSSSVSTASVSTTPAAPVVTNGLVTKNLQATKDWLLTNNEGVNYINNSYFQSRDASLQWDGEAKISDFYFQWPLLADSKCSIVFSGPYHANEVFKAQCFDSNGNLITSKDSVDSPLSGYDLPLLPFKQFVSNLLADKSLMADFDTYFAKSDKILALFRLYKNVKGTQVWEGKFIDEKSGYFMIVNTDASKTNGSFNVTKGVF